MAIIFCLPSTNGELSEVGKPGVPLFARKETLPISKVQNSSFYLIESAPMKDQIPSARLNVDKIITYYLAIMVLRKS